MPDREVRFNINAEIKFSFKLGAVFVFGYRTAVVQLLLNVFGCRKHGYRQCHPAADDAWSF